MNLSVVFLIFYIMSSVAHCGINLHRQKFQYELYIIQNRLCHNERIRTDHNIRTSTNGKFPKLDFYRLREKTLMVQISQYLNKQASNRGCCVFL